MVEIILIAVGLIAGITLAGLGATNKLEGERRKYLELLTNQKIDIVERDVIIKEQTTKIDQLIKERNLYHIELDSLKEKLIDLIIELNNDLPLPQGITIKKNNNIKPEAYEEIEIVS